MKTPEQRIDFDDFLAGNDGVILARADEAKRRAAQDQLMQVAAMGGEVG